MNKVKTVVLFVAVCGSFLINPLATKVQAGIFGPSKAELANEVKSDIIETFKANSDTSSIRVVDLALVHNGGNIYSGILTTVENGSRVKHSIKVVCDGESFQWEIED